MAMDEQTDPNGTYSLFHRLELLGGYGVEVASRGRMVPSIGNGGETGWFPIGLA